ncbi:hypothetical protein LABF125_18960 [Lactobacillus amylovorus subsp. animalium]|uniref:Transposase n=1 Tax=Lactobacillus amylovorus subsp. animalium TaxID=3378536 RepID=A0ABQ6P204_LACAM|nr:hypothetical protein LABF125_18960 [Lactobacillus amylovorus]
MAEALKNVHKRSTIDKTAASVMHAFRALQKQYSEHWNDIITTDNVMARSSRI